MMHEILHALVDKPIRCPSTSLTAILDAYERIGTAIEGLMIVGGDCAA